MDFLLQTILSYLLLYKYLALFGVTFLAALALPIPAAATVMASAAFASQGYFNINLVAFWASLGNILGDTAGYWLARGFGQPVLRAIGLGKLLDSAVFHALASQVRKKTAPIVFFSRFEVLATLSVNFICGLGKISYWKYLAYQAPGEMVQVLLFVTVGYLVGSGWQEINNLLGGFSLVIGLVLIVLIMLLWRRITKWLIKKELEQ